MTTKGMPAITSICYMWYMRGGIPQLMVIDRRRHGKLKMGLDGWRNSGPVRHRKWQCRDFHAVTAGFSFADHRAVCRLLEALRHQTNPADRGRTLIESDHGVGDIGFLE